MHHREVVLAEPSGFCAGVEAALKSLAWLVALNPPPVACVHAVVHNEDVVSRFEALGVRFVERPEDAPSGSAVLLSAHGSPPGAAARASNAYVVVDAACPLVTKVHREMQARSRAGDTIIYVGHRGHDEAEGAIAHATVRVHVVEHARDVAALPIPHDRHVAVLAQTTVAVADWEDVVDRVRPSFASTWTSGRADICFATTNRQAAVRAIAAMCDAIVVVGSSTSSNTAALAQTARDAGAQDVYRVNGPDELPFLSSRRIGVTAGASTPVAKVEAVVHALGATSVRTLRVVDEHEYFPLAPGVRRQIEAAIGAGAIAPELVAAYRSDRSTSADALLDLLESSTELPRCRVAASR